MSQVIVVASGKGGTGKTTVSTSLALSLAKKNNRVLVIDCDSGMRGVDMMLGITDRLVHDMSDVISGACSFVILKIVLLSKPQNRRYTGVFQGLRQRERANFYSKTKFSLSERSE